MFSVAIIRDWRKTAGEDKPGCLDVRVTIDRKSYYISTGIRVLAKHWAGAVVARPDADELNNRLGIIVKRVNEKMNEFIEKRQPIDVNSIKRYIYDGTKSDAGGSMLEWMKKQVPLLQVSEDTREHYWLLIDRLGQYGQLRAWSDLSVEAIYAWDAWLHDNVKAQVKKGAKEKKASDGTVWNYHKHLKALLHRAFDFGVIQQNPYDRMVGKFKRGDDENVEYLTEDQMELILNTHPVPGTQMETVRDLFVFQMYTGLSYSDMMAFDIKEYRQEGDEWVHIGKRIKTGVPYVSVLLPPVIDVLERNGWKVPNMTNQKYNVVLKTFGAAIGIEGLHSHLARHTFGTYMLSNDAKLQNVMRMMGHKNIRQTLRYAKVLPKDVKEDYGKVVEKLRDRTEIQPANKRSKKEKQ